MKLFYRQYGSLGPNLIIVHGLYGASDNWVSIGKQLAEHFKVYIVDQRNHGGSPHSNSHSFQDMSNDLMEFMNDTGIEKAHLIGHSMGGKTVLRFCIEHPDKVEKLIAVDIAPKSYGTGSNYGLITNDHATIVKALLNTPLDELNKRQEIDRHLAKEIPKTSVRQFLLKNITRSKEGKFIWKLNIKVISENLEEILDGFSDLPPEKHKCENLAIFIKGEKSNYLLEEDMFIAKKYFPNSEFITIPDTGHWLHAEQPELFIKTILYFLQD